MLKNSSITKVTNWAAVARASVRTNLEMYEKAFHDLFDTHCRQANDSSHYQDLRRGLYERFPYKTSEAQLAEWLIEDNRAPGLTSATEAVIKEIATNAFKSIRVTIAEIYQQSDKLMTISATDILEKLQAGLSQLGKSEFKSRINTLMTNYRKVQQWISDKANVGTEIAAKLELFLDSQNFDHQTLKEIPAELHEAIGILQSDSLSQLYTEITQHYTKDVTFTKFKRSLSSLISNDESSSDPSTPPVQTIHDVLKEFAEGIEKLKNRGMAPSEIGQLVTAAGVMSEQSQNIQGDAYTPKSRLGDFQLVRQDIPGITKIGALKTQQKGSLHRLDEILIRYIQQQNLEVYTVSKKALAQQIEDELQKRDSKLTEIFEEMFKAEIKAEQNPAILYADLFQARFGLLDLDCSSYSTTSWSQAINDLYIAGLICRNSPIEFRPLESPSFKACKLLVSLGIHQKDLHLFSSNEELLSAFIDPSIPMLDLAHLSDEVLKRVSDAKAKFNQLGMKRDSVIPDGLSLTAFTKHLTYQIDGLHYLSDHDNNSERTLDETKEFLGDLVGQFEGFFQHDRQGNLLTDVASIFDPIQKKWIDNPNSRTIDTKSDPKGWWEAKGKVSLDELSKLVQAGYLAKLEISPESGQVQWVFYPPTQLEGPMTSPPQPWSLTSALTYLWGEDVAA